MTVADDDTATRHAVLSVHVADTGPAVMGDLVGACTRQAGGNWLIGTRTFRPALAGDPGTAGEGHAVDLEALVL